MPDKAEELKWKVIKHLANVSKSYRAYIKHTEMFLSIINELKELNKTEALNDLMIMDRFQVAFQLKPSAFRAEINKAVNELINQEEKSA